MGVLAAMRQEVSPLIDSLAQARRPDRQVPIVIGLCGEVELAVSWTGEGSRLAVAGTRRLLELPGGDLDGCLMVGVAGALSPTLEAGALLSAEKVVRLPAEASSRPEGALAVAPLQFPGARPGLLLEVDRMVSLPEERRALWKKLGEPPVAAVDMESFGVTEELLRAGVPCAVLRVISDTARDNLPGFLASCHDPERGFVRARVVRHLMARPWALGRLLKLRSRVHAGSLSLRDCVVGWCQEGAPSMARANRSTL